MRLSANASTVLLASILSYTPMGLRGGQGSGGAQQEATGRALSAPQRRVVFGGAFWIGMSMPYWDRGYLIIRNLETASAGTPNVWLYDAQGNRVGEAAIWIPGSVRVILSHAAVTVDGHLALTGFAEQKDSTQAFFIALADRAGKVIRVIQTNPFVPMQLCAAPDGTVWTAGGIRSDNQEQRDASEVVRHFDFDRGLTEAYLPLSSFRTRRDVAGKLGPRPEAYFGCSAERVVLYSGVANQYVELTTSNHSIRRWRIDRSLHDLPLHGFALTASGELYAGFYDQEKPSGSSGLYYLQRDDSAGTVRWMPVESSDPQRAPMQSFGYLFGADGEFLVHHDREDGRILYWSAPSHAGKTN